MPAPSATSSAAGAPWPDLSPPWSDTRDTLHMWTQIVGKTRLALAPMINQWWQVPLYVTARGLGTSAMPVGARTLDVEFDFLDRKLVMRTSDGRSRTMALAPRSVADFYAEYLELLRALDVTVSIWPVPVEVPNPIPFRDDHEHASYDAGAAERFWGALRQSARVMTAFRGRFEGKASPVHFFWGSFDLAATRFSGRRAPERPGQDAITREAYSHEVISAGFWPGSGPVPEAAYYAYAVPEPEGFREAHVRPAAAFYEKALGEFVLPYESVRTAADPDGALLDFLESSYDAGADLGKWNRAELERPPTTRDARST